MIFLDFETFSHVDLSVVGGYNYVDHPSTRVLCMAWCTRGGNNISVWKPAESFPEELANRVVAGERICGFGDFDFKVWNKVLPRHLANLPVLPLEQYVDGFAMAAAMSLPISLDKLSKFFNLKHKKATDEKQIMLALSKPNDLPLEHEFYRRLYEYCLRDVLALEELVANHLYPLCPINERNYRNTCKLNDNGIFADRAELEAVGAFLDKGKELGGAELSALTGGKVTSLSQSKRINKYAAELGGFSDSVAGGGKVARALSTNPRLEELKTVLDRYSGGAAAKIATALNRQSEDGRIRGAYTFHGAHSGRLSSRGLQVQNLTRPPKGLKLKDAEDNIANILNGHPASYDKVNAGIRAFFRASPGCKLSGSDLSSIESRMLAFLAKEEWKLEVHAKGLDVYKAVYSQSFGVSLEQVDDSMRQIGKVEDLSLGYQGADGAFKSMAKVYGVALPDEVIKEVIKKFRSAHVKTAQFWKDLERAGMFVLANPGEVRWVGSSKFNFVAPHLIVTLPSGRDLVYPNAEFGISKFGKPCVQYSSVNTTTGKLNIEQMYGGCWAENLVQAASADVLFDATDELIKAGRRVTMLTHDEIIVDEAEDCRSEITAALVRGAEWTQGLPLAAKDFISVRHWKF